MNQSYFDGSLVQYIGYRLIGILVTLVTFGLATPWAIVIIERWRCEHTTIDGKRLIFVGTATDLFGQWIIWLILTVVTLGIYSFWLQIKMQQWVVKNTHFEGNTQFVY